MLACLCVVASAQAAAIQIPVKSVVACNGLYGWGGYGANNMIVPDDRSNYPGTVMYGYGSLWRANVNDGSGTLPSAVFTFNELSDVASVEIWNYMESNGHTAYGAKDILMEFSASGLFDETWEAVEGVNSFAYTLLSAMAEQGIVYGKHPGDDPIVWTGPDAVIAFDNDISALAVRITILSGQGGSDSHLNQSGLCQVEFFNAVPEPATMTLLALGGLALLRRRR